MPQVPAPTRADGRSPSRRPVDRDESALIMYTSGTTGLPKGVILSRRAIAAGRTDVAVMPAGIRDWVDEGRPVERPAAG